MCGGVVVVAAAVIPTNALSLESACPHPTPALSRHSVHAREAGSCVFWTFFSNILIHTII